MLTLPGGQGVPADLLGLLHRASTVARLTAAGIETTAALLRLDADGRRFTPRTGPALWLAVEELLAERWPGVLLGCLARPEPIVQGQSRSRAPPRATAALDQLAHLHQLYGDPHGHQDIAEGDGDHGGPGGTGGLWLAAGTAR